MRKSPRPRDGLKRLKVLYCAICRTDAKIWNEGHRDLILPRVPGHEIAAIDENEQRFVIWPGTSCNKCRYCRTGREKPLREYEDHGVSS